MESFKFGQVFKFNQPIYIQTNHPNEVRLEYRVSKKLPWQVYTDIGNDGLILHKPFTKETEYRVMENVRTFNSNTKYGITIKLVKEEESIDRPSEEETSTEEVSVVLTGSIVSIT